MVGFETETVCREKCRKESVSRGVRVRAFQKEQCISPNGLRNSAVFFPGYGSRMHGGTLVGRESRMKKDSFSRLSIFIQEAGTWDRRVYK